MAQFTKQERRPCIVTIGGRRYDVPGEEPDERPALFHLFAPVAEVIAPSCLRGGHNGGQLAGIMALVEFSDGTLATVEPSRVRFLDSPRVFGDYDWTLRDSVESERHCYTCKYSAVLSSSEPCCNCINSEKWEARP